MQSEALPELYKKTETGAIQRWVISVDGIDIITQFGQVGGKTQSTMDTIREGKNQGRKGETGPEEQALKEAKSRWIKKKKAGYVESLKDSESGKTDAIISGGVLPMLAKVYEDYSSKIIYPASIQPKLDGHRCIAIVSSGKATLWSRTRKRITSVPHIEEAVEGLARENGLKELVIDGELYNHELRDDFEKITSITRKKEKSEESVKIQYHIYDRISTGDFRSRYSKLDELFYRNKSHCLKIVETWQVDDEFEVMNFYDRFRKMGYEGAMLRQHTGNGYEGKRTDKLLKIKSFTDGEFKIVLVEEGRGKLQGHAGNFLCETSSGKIFGAKLAGNTERLKTIFENKKEYIGQLLTVKYQGLTKDGIPRFPVGLRIREDL